MNHLCAKVVLSYAKNIVFGPETHSKHTGNITTRYQNDNILSVALRQAAEQIFEGLPEENTKKRLFLAWPKSEKNGQNLVAISATRDVCCPQDTFRVGVLLVSAHRTRDENIVKNVT